MNNLWWAQLAWTQIWQVTVTSLVIWLIVRFCARHRPRLAYLLWMLVIIKCLTPPIWNSSWGVFSHVMILAPWSSSPAAVEPLDVDEAGMIHAKSSAAIALQQPTDRTQDSIWVGPATNIQSPQVSQLFLLGLAGLWLGGVLIVAGKIAWKWRRFQRHLQTGHASPQLVEQLLDVAVKLSLRRLPRIVWTEYATVPAVFGYWQPTLVLPKFLLTSAVDVDLEPILAHELVHVRRGDTLAGRLQLLVQALWWFHPLVWWTNFEARRERERSCDEMVISLMGYDPLRYAGCLIRIAELTEQFRCGRSTYPPTCIAAIGSFRLLANRLEHITTHAAVFHRRLTWAYTATALTLAFALLPGATQSVWSRIPQILQAGSSSVSAQNLRGSANIEPMPSVFQPATQPDMVHAPKLEGISIDGKLDDWPATMPKHAFRKIFADGAASWSGTDFSTSPDLSCEFMTGYSPSEQKLYVAVVVRDDKLILGNSSHRDTDGMELYVDGLRSNRQYPWNVGPDPLWFEKVRLENLPVQQYCAIPGDGPVYGASKLTNPLLIAGDLEKTNTKMAFTRVGTVITYEWAVQVFDRYPDLPTKLEPGKRIGFDVVVVDKDVPLRGWIENEPQTDRRAWIYWGPEWRGMKVLNAGSLGEIVLGE